MSKRAATTEIIRVRNPEALDFDPFRRLFLAAWQATDAVSNGWTEAVEKVMREAIANPNHHILIALEGGLPTALVCSDTTANPVAFAPLIYAIYNEGKSATLRRLLHTLRANLRKVGHSHVYVLNGLMRDSTHIRLFRAVAPGRKVASVLQYDIQE